MYLRADTSIVPSHALDSPTGSRFDEELPPHETNSPYVSHLAKLPSLLEQPRIFISIISVSVSYVFFCFL
ncbi:hypothetical protein E4T56_gene12296 [Termitomyces sp. T112]|nr:hypothetical protein E4T56_gene12296 [Termitomyces sp. T112]